MSELTDWLEDRRRHVTASEFGAILGHGYAGQTAFTVWDEKVNGNRGVFADEIVLEAGSALEDVAARGYERMTGSILIDPGRHTLIEHTAIPWISCTVDRLYESEWRSHMSGDWSLFPRDWFSPIEIKWMGIGAYVDREEWKQDQPLRQQLQLQGQMSVLGASSGVLLGAFMPGCELCPVEKQYDAELFEAIFPVLEKFWHCVRDRITPNPDDYSVDCKSVRRIYDTINRKTVRISRQEDIIAVNEWLLNRSARLEFERKESAAQARVLAAIGENAYGALPDGSAIKRTVVKRKAYSVEESSYIKLEYKDRV